MEEKRPTEEQPVSKRAHWEGRPSKAEYQYLFAVAGVVIVTCCAIILFYFSVKRYSGLKEGWNTFINIIQPFIIGAVMAFLMNPIMKFLERQFKVYLLPKSKPGKLEKNKKTIRMVSSILSLLILVGIISAFVFTVVPQLVSTVQYLLRHLDRQLMGVLEWADEITGGRYHKSIAGAERDMDVDLWLDTAWKYVAKYLEITETEKMVETVATGIFSAGKIFANTIIGIIVSVYILIDKEKIKAQFKKIVYGWFRPKQANVVVSTIRKANEIFYGFIVGKILDSIIIGIICYVCMLIFGFPYPVLCSVIIGLTNIIPVFGPYIGAVPTVIIIFLTNPMKGIYFLLFVFILQQVDGNIIGPKILGDSTGLSSFWVVVAIVVGAGIGGIVGMLIGVPTMALIYYICGKLARYFVARRNLPTDTDAYVYLQQVNVETNAMECITPEEKAAQQMHFFGKHKKH